MFGINLSGTLRVAVVKKVRCKSSSKMKEWFRIHLKHQGCGLSQAENLDREYVSIARRNLKKNLCRL